jgi:hypothetical protein
MAYFTTPALIRIQQLEAERTQLYALRWREEHERERLIRIRAELDSAWDQRRLETAGARAGGMPDNVRSADEFAEPHRARRSYRSRTYGGRTWAEAEALAMLEL